MSIRRVVHCKRQDFDVYIGRPTKWGNPFRIGKDGSREVVIQKYRDWITKGEGQYLLQDLGELEGMILGCWCAPLPCHGDILVELVIERFP